MFSWPTITMYCWERGMRKTWNQYFTDSSTLTPDPETVKQAKTCFWCNQLIRIKTVGPSQLWLPKLAPYQTISVKSDFYYAVNSVRKNYLCAGKFFQTSGWLTERYVVKNLNHFGRWLEASLTNRGNILREEFRSSWKFCLSYVLSLSILNDSF